MTDPTPAPADWFAARRHLTGLSVTELAAHMAVNPRTIRSWESGRDPIPARIDTHLDALVEDHTTDTLAGVSGPEMGRGWRIAALARHHDLKP